MERPFAFVARRTAAAALAAVWTLWLASTAAASDPGEAPGDERAPVAASPEGAVDAPAEVEQHAEEVAARLREMAASLEDEALFGEIEAQTEAAGQRVGALWLTTGRQLASYPSNLVLRSLENAWGGLRADLEVDRERIDRRARQRETDLSDLERLKASWTSSRELASQAEMPAAVLDRIDSTLAAIDATRRPVERRRARVLVAQDAVSRSLQACDDALARVADARARVLTRILLRQRPPLWSSPPSLAALADARVAAAATLGDARANLRYWAADHVGGIAFSLLACVALAVGLRRVRASGAEPDASLGPAAAVFRTPVAAAIVLGLLLTPPLRPHSPLGIDSALMLAAMLAAIAVVRHQVPRRQVLLAAALVVLVLLDLLTQAFVVEPSLEQAATFVLQASAALVVWQLSRSPAFAVEATGAWRALLRLIALACLVATGAAALGYLELASFLGSGALYVVFSGSVVVALRSVLRGLVVLATAHGPLARMRSIDRHRPVLRARVLRAVDLLMVVWFWVALERFGMLPYIARALDAFVGSRLQVGLLDLPVANLLGFAAVVVGTFLATRVLVVLLEEEVYSRMALPRGVPFALSSLTRYAMLVAGFLLALAALGLDLTHLTVLVSAVGVGLGFGLQNVVKDFFAGLILLFERPIQLGDTVQLEALVGEVERIGARASRIRTSEGAEVVLPNSALIEQRLTNWTLSDRTRRIDVDVHVRAPVDGARVLAAMLEVARADARVLPSPEPEALAVRFGADVADFQLRVFSEDARWMRLRSDLALAIDAALRAAPKGAV